MDPVLAAPLLFLAVQSPLQKPILPPYSSLNQWESASLSMNDGVEQILAYLPPKKTVLKKSANVQQYGVKPYHYETLSQEIQRLETESLDFQLAWVERGYKLKPVPDLFSVSSDATLNLSSLLPDSTTVHTAQFHPQAQSIAIQSTSLSGGSSQSYSDSQNNVSNQSLQLVASHPVYSNTLNQYVEAFLPTETVPDVDNKMISIERRFNEEQALGWQLSHAPHHVSTLHWSDPTSDYSEANLVPLLSHNTMLLLGTLSGTTVQEDAGIVFGIVPRGWEMVFSGRSERPLYLTEDLQQVDSSRQDIDRYFVLLNVAPGAHLVYLRSTQDANLMGAVGVPVMSGAASYLDLTHISFKTLSGHVFETNEQDSGITEVMQGALVRVVGQESQVTTTDSAGKFILPHVMTVSNYPFFIETERGTGYTHRYRVLARKMKNLSLFRLSSSQINTWLSMLAGGVSASSGLVVAAKPALVAQYPDQMLFPQIKSLTSDGNSPEVYTVSTTGQLVVHEPLSTLETRFVGVEVPEGPVAVQIADSTDQPLWGELTIASPGVVSIVGP